MKILIFYGFGIICILLTIGASGEEAQIPDDWVEPHAWRNVQKTNRILVDVGKYPHEEAQQFYRKLVNFLFDKSKLRPNGELLTRTIHLHITPKMLERLHNAQTARDIDSVVFEVIEMSREGRMEQVKEIVISVTDMISMSFNEIYHSDTLLFFFLVVITLTFVWIISRTLKRNIILVFLLTIFAISFFLMYLDCNAHLEIKKLMELNKQHGNRNPCQVKQSSFIWPWGRSSSEDECLKHLTESYGPQRSICRPTEVLLQFVSHLTVTQFTTFVHESQSTFSDILEKYSWKQQIIILPLVLYFTYLMVSLLIKYTFRYIFPPMISSLNTHGDNPQTVHQNAPESDRIVLSGDSVQKLMNLLAHSTKITLKEAEGALETEAGDRVQVLPREKSPYVPKNKHKKIIRKSIKEKKKNEKQDNEIYDKPPEPSEPPADECLEDSTTQ